WRQALALLPSALLPTGLTDVTRQAADTIPIRPATRAVVQAGLLEGTGRCEHWLWPVRVRQALRDSIRASTWRDAFVVIDDIKRIQVPRLVAVQACRCGRNAVRLAQLLLLLVWIDRL